MVPFRFVSIWPFKTWRMGELQNPLDETANMLLIPKATALSWYWGVKRWKVEASLTVVSEIEESPLPLTLTRTEYTRLYGYFGGTFTEQTDIAAAVVNPRADGFYEPAGPFVLLDESADSYYTGFSLFYPEFVPDPTPGNPAGVLVQVLLETPGEGEDPEEVAMNVRVPFGFFFGDTDNRYYVSTFPPLAGSADAIVTINMDGISIPAFFVSDNGGGTEPWSLVDYSFVITREEEWSE
jgi:hypothetical protein